MGSPRGLTALLWLSGIACVAPLFAAPILPFSDMPEQVAVIGTLRHWLDPAFSDPYVFDFGKSQYVLYHVVGALLAIPLGSAELANLALLSIVGVATPFAMRALLRALGRDERLALFSASLFWSRPLVMGFLPYVAAVPIVLYGLALAARQADEPRRGRGFALALLSIALFFLHVDPFLLFVMAAALGQLAAARPLRLGALFPAAKGLAWLAPALAVAAAWAAFGSLRGSVDHGHLVFMPLRDVIRELPAWSHDVFRSHTDEACAIVVWLAFAALVVQRGRDGLDRRGLLRAAAPFAAATLCYFLLPYSVGAAVMLNVRIAVFVALFAPLFIDRIDGKRGLVPLGAVAAANFVLAGYAFREITAVADDEVGDVSRLLDRIPRGARVVTLPFHLTSPRMHWAPWTFVGAYHRARHGGVASFSFTQIDHWPLHYREGAEPPHKPLFWTFDACGYRNETDGRYYDYVLVRGNVDPFRDAPPGPAFRRVDAERDLVLYERVPGVENPAWAVADRGPCESRRSLELREARGDVEGPLGP